MKKIQELWNKLPKEAKVGVYVVASASLTELVKYLSGLQIDDAITMAFINIIIVCLVELAKRIQAQETE